MLFQEAFLIPSFFREICYSLKIVHFAKFSVACLPLQMPLQKANKFVPRWYNNEFGINKAFFFMNLSFVQVWLYSSRNRSEPLGGTPISKRREYMPVAKL